MPVKSFSVFADYFQIVLQDENADGPEGDLWTDEASAARLAVGRDLLAFSTARNMDVPVEIAISPKEPILDLAQWDHVVEGAIALPSGRMIVAGPTDFVPDAVRVAAAAGRYRVRVLSAGLDALSEDGLDGNDRYRVELWPGAARPVRVVKAYQPATGQSLCA